MATQKDNKDHRITGYIVILADMETISPLRIGSGHRNRADVEVIRLPGGEPYLPASGFIGALYHRYLDREQELNLKRAAELFWGTDMADDDGTKATWQSHLRAADMELTAPAGERVRMRDGVRIDHKTNTAEDGKKFDYEMLEPGYTFTFRAEITLRAGFNEQEVAGLKELVRFVRYCLENGLRIGGMTTRGFGQTKCKEFRVRHFDFQGGDEAGREAQRKDWFAFLKREDFSADLPARWKPLTLQVQEGLFSIRATFSLRSSLLIGSPGGPQDEVEKVQLRSRGKPVISGRSLAGVVRHRSLKILRTMGMAGPAAEEMVNGLFGHVSEVKGGKTRARKSRLITHEAPIEFAGTEKKQKQTRIRIDRFTGGVIRGGLFESQPVWRQEGHSVTLRMDIERSEPWEQALLLHVLKDLWTGDLAIGGEKNVGRGVLEGDSATVRFGEEELTISTENGQIRLDGDPEARQNLQEAETAFLSQFKIQESA